MTQNGHNDLIRQLRHNDDRTCPYCDDAASALEQACDLIQTAVDAKAGNVWMLEAHQWLNTYSPKK